MCKVNKTALILRVFSIVQTRRFVALRVNLPDDHSTNFIAIARFGNVVNGERAAQHTVTSPYRYSRIRLIPQYPVVSVHPSSTDTGIAATQHLAKFRTRVARVSRCFSATNSRVEYHAAGRTGEEKPIRKPIIQVSFTCGVGDSIAIEIRWCIQLPADQFKV